MEEQNTSRELQRATRIIKIKSPGYSSYISMPLWFLCLCFYCLFRKRIIQTVAAFCFSTWIVKLVFPKKTRPRVVSMTRSSFHFHFLFFLFFGDVPSERRPLLPQLIFLLFPHLLFLLLHLSSTNVVKQVSCGSPPCRRAQWLVPKTQCASVRSPVLSPRICCFCCCWCWARVLPQEEKKEEEKEEGRRNRALVDDIHPPRTRRSAEDV